MADEKSLIRNDAVFMYAALKQLSTNENQNFFYNCGNAKRNIWPHSTVLNQQEKCCARSKSEPNYNKSTLDNSWPPVLNLSKNYLLVACITNLKRMREKLFKLSRQQGQIIDVKGEKSQ